MKVVVVSGAARGLGLAISKLLVRQGYLVIGIGRTLTEDYAQLIEQNKSNCFFYEFDLGNIDQLSKLIKDITKTHGRLYGLINNAAIGHDGVLSTMHESQISELINVNVTSPIVLTKYASRSMLLNGEGRIINVGSIIGSTGFNGLSVYGATKSSLAGFTKSLSRELGKGGVTVNTLAPGYMKTNMTAGLEGEKLQSIIRRSPLGELASVEDAAAMVEFLLSDNARSMTGATFTVDAGSTA